MIMQFLNSENNQFWKRTGPTNARWGRCFGDGSKYFSNINILTETYSMGDKEFCSVKRLKKALTCTFFVISLQVFPRFAN